MVSWKTCAVLILAVHIGTLTQVLLVQGKLSADEDKDVVRSQPAQQGLENSRIYSVIQERGLLGRIRAPFDKLVQWIKEKIKNKLEKTWHTKKLTKPCYPEVGCFYYNESMRLEIGGPQSPEEVNVTFYFFKNGSEYIDELLNENKTTVIPNQTYTIDNFTLKSKPDILDITKPLTVVTHGLTGSKRTPWMLPLVEALLNNIETTVLVVDWEKGANGTYPDAGINTPMAGALLSVFLQRIKNETKDVIGPDNITLIGFSMGAQVMGFTGRHFFRATKKKLHRITGLDPAGWMYENTNATLTKHDANYVDVIHTDAGSITEFRIGLNQSVGHVDFYPNGGTVQEGCKGKPNLVYTDYMDVITCSHYRATALFIESLVNKNCSFMSWGCDNWTDFTTGECLKRITENNTSVMGYYSYEAKGRGDQFLYTNSRSPYCRGNNTSPPKQDSVLPWWKRIWQNKWWKFG